MLESLRPSAAPVPEGPLAVAVSGGGDSVVLLLALRQAGWSAEQLVVLHLDHARRPDSAADAAWVAALAERHGLRFRSRRLPEAGAASPAALRALRQAALQDMARDCRAVALAHTADDQWETRLMAMLRGAGLSGLAGMRAWRAPWWRPLLGLSRAALREWLRAQGQDWLEDPANTDFRRLRARLRHLWRPAIGREIDPAAEAMRVAVLQAEDDWLAEAARTAAARCIRAGRLEVARFRSEPLVLQRRVLADWLGPGSGVRQVETLRQLLAVDADRLRELECPGGWSVLIGRAGAVRTRGLPADGVALPDGGMCWGVCGALRSLHDQSASSGWSVRTLGRLPDDSARPLHALLRAAGLPAELRAVWPVLHADDGRSAMPWPAGDVAARLPVRFVSLDDGAGRWEADTGWCLQPAIGVESGA